jgi:2',3'-cyclic-nucleotide 2'-phosphodiesterase (5'-nucleotidase family)
VFGICINTPTTPYVTYEDYASAAGRVIGELKGRTDFIVAITHLSISDDRKLAAQFPEIRLILGGHEHTHSYDTVGRVLIAKADANARTVYIHQLDLDKSNSQLDIHTQLVDVDNRVPEEPVTKAVVDKWIGIADRSLRAQGFIPDDILATVSVPYDGRESEVRYRPTNLSTLIAKAMSAAVPGSDCSIFNSGSIRLDDELTGTITQYDIVRTLPYGGIVMKAAMKGSLLKRALDSAARHPGNGCFVQYDRISKDKKGRWLVNGKALHASKVYTVAVNDYLVSGQQQYLEFLNDKNPEMISISAPAETDLVRKDIRQAVIAYLRSGGR